VTPLDDAPAAGGRRAAVREREEAVVGALRSLGTALDGEPDPAFRAATRARLVAMAAVRTPEPAPEERSRLSRLLALRGEPVRSPLRRRLTAGLAAAALAVTALATLVAVASGARPGDPLYDLKRGTEQTELALSGSDRGVTLLGFAHTRLTELAALTGDGDTDLAVRTLRAMDEATTDGAAAVAAQAVAGPDPATARGLAAWGAGQSAGLAALQPRLPAGARPAADAAAALVARVTDRGTALAAALRCPAGPAVGGSDPLGPVPLPCPAPAAGSQPEVGGTPGTAPASGTATPAPPATAGAPSGGAVGGPTAGGSGTAGSGTGGGAAPSVPPATSTGSPGAGTGGSLPPPVGGAPGTGTTAPHLPVPLPAPLPALPSLPLPVPPPGSSLGTGSAGSGGAGTGTGPLPLPGVSVCVPPLTIGSC
jgi:hypothetical protein